MAHPAPTDTKASASAQHGHEHGDHAAHHVNYVKIYWILLALLGVSIAGPEFGIRAVTLFTAFGIAVIKAYMVAANFMHLKFEKRYIGYLMFTALAFMFLFYAGTSPDVMMHRGRNWDNVAAKKEIERAQQAEADGHGHGQHEGH
jgi:caa(3)-type oxidase subunit IV